MLIFLIVVLIALMLFLQHSSERFPTERVHDLQSLGFFQRKNVALTLN